MKESALLWVRCPKREATEAVLAGAEAKSLRSNNVPLKERKKRALGEISVSLVAEVQEVVTSAAGNMQSLLCYILQDG